MALPNRVSAVLAQTDSDAVLAACTTIRQKLPFLLALTSDEKKSLPRIDEAAQPWSAKMYEIANQHPDFLPRGFDLAEMKRDVDLWASFIPLYQAVASLMQLFDNTYTAIATDAYSEALAVYAIGSKSDIGTEGLENLMDEMSKRFVHKVNPPKTSSSPDAKASK